VGVTGAQSQLSNSHSKEIQAVRKVTDKSIAIGFGISTPDQVLEASKSADAVVVGSHLLNLIEQSPDVVSAKNQICSFIQESIKILNLGGLK
jgi:tryptophan synthase alpha chain